MLFQFYKNMSNQYALTKMPQEQKKLSGRERRPTRFYLLSYEIPDIKDTELLTMKRISKFS